MEARLFNNLHRQTLSDSLEGSGSVFPTLVQGSDISLKFRFAERTEDGAVEARREIVGVHCSIGFPDARPTSGTFRIIKTAGAVDSGAIPFNASAAAFQAALAPLFPGIIEETVAVDGSWLVLTNAELPPFTWRVALSPLSFLRWTSAEDDPSGFLYEFRLTQAPLAFTDQFRLTLPPRPAVAVVQEGETFEDILFPEIQSLRLDPWFTGVYRLRRGSRVSGDLSPEDGPEEIAEALLGCLSPAEIANGAEITVANVGIETAHITFGGSLAGIDEDLLEVEVIDAPTGNPTITLDLSGAAMASALRKGKITPEFELTWWVKEQTEAGEEAEQTRKVTGFRGPVTVLPSLSWDALATHPETNWTAPPDPTNYIPWKADQIIVGERFYPADLGTGSAHLVHHGLGTWNVAGVQVREKIPGGRLLVHGVDYEAELVSVDETRILIQSAYTAGNPLAVIISTAGPEDHFKAHTHTRAQVDGLDLILSELTDRISNLESMVPSGALAVVPDPAGPFAEWPLPAFAEVFPSRVPVTIPATGISGVDLGKNRLSGLFPAIHTITAPASLPVPLPFAPTLEQCGKVWRNAGSGPITLPGGGGLRSYKLAPNELAGAYWDANTNSGRWFPVVLEAGTSSYHPTQMGRDLFEIFIPDGSLLQKRRFRLEFGFETAVLRALTRGQWDLVVEYGSHVAAATPGTPGLNIEAWQWNTAAPAIRQRVFAGPVPAIHRVSLEVARAANGDLTAAKTIFGAKTSAPAPVGPVFGIRARLTRWDTTEGPDLRGFLAIKGLAATVGEEDAATVGKAWIE